MNQSVQIIRRIVNKGDYLQITLECGLTFGTPCLSYEKDFEVGEQVIFQSGRNRYQSYIFKLKNL